MSVEANNAPGPPAVLIAGATGYVGGRVLTALEQSGCRVRCLARRPDLLAPRVGKATEVVFGDLSSSASLADAMHGIETAYYLVSTCGGVGGFPDRERRAAANFAIAARQNGLRGVVCLARLGSPGAKLPDRVRVSHEVGKLLADAHVPVIEFRAAPIVGSGSVAFEAARSLADRLRFAVAPTWGRACCPLIAVEDVVAYLLAARHRTPQGREVFEIGPAELASFAALARQCARREARRRLVVPLPLACRRLSVAWMTLLTPLPARLCRTLVESLQAAAAIAPDASAVEAFGIRPRGLQDAVDRAMACEGRRCPLTHWSGAMGPAGDLDRWSGVALAPRVATTCSQTVPCAPAEAFELVSRVGGQFGWHGATRLWRFRGVVDRLVGGPGLRQGRPGGCALRPGSVVDSWRVEAVEPERRLLLAAEMKLPGRAWLELAVKPAEGGAAIRLTATFDPAGLWGRAYWHLFGPLRAAMLKGMLRRIARQASQAGMAGRLEIIPTDPATW